MTLLEQILPLLPHVSKPIQYIGEEINAVQKRWQDVDVRVGLCFPDLYEVGMSHLGLHLLYHILNADPAVAAERLYAPAVDMEARMRANQIPLFSLESHRAAADFDLLGFTLQYELSYSNVLNMLSLAGIPLLREERAEADPLILAGGPCSCNPEPLADICDFLVIGDGESVVPQIVALYRSWKASQQRKSEFLRQVASLPGVYVPSFYTVRYESSGQVRDIRPNVPEAPEFVRRVVEPDLETTEYLTAPIVPYLKPVHDRLTLEVMRGCPRGCRFCQAGYIYRPKRERSSETLLDLAASLLSTTGYDEISLSSLSTGDYSEISRLLATLMQSCEASRVSLSLPSMRVSTLTKEMAAVIRQVRKTGFTIAPEAGTQRLRDVINKGISETEIFQTAEEAFSAGWDLLKLYFMFGLPTEKDEDIEGILDLVFRIWKMGKKVTGKRVKLNVAVSSFVPKAHTPFQWERMFSIEQLREKQDRFKQGIRSRAIQLKWHDVRTSYLEGVFARGDRRLGQVLLEAHRLGCKFDGWNEHFDFAKWMTAFSRAGVDPDWYVFRERQVDEVLPWDHISTGVSKDYLWNERLKGIREEETPPCTGQCRRCGVCDDELRILESASGGDENASSNSTASPSASATTVARPKAFRVRAMFSKRGLLRFLSHLELGRVFQRAIARINAPIAFSQGFHPHPYIAFGPALPVGMEGKQEFVDFFFTETIDIEVFLARMNTTLPTGIQIVRAEALDLKEPSLSSTLRHFTFQVSVPESLVLQGYTAEYLSAHLHEFHSQETWLVHGFKKFQEAVDIKPFISFLEVTTGEAGLPCLRMGLVMWQNTIMKPAEVLNLVFEFPYEHGLDCRILRVSLDTEPEPQRTA